MIDYCRAFTSCLQNCKKPLRKFRNSIKPKTEEWLLNLVWSRLFKCQCISHHPAAAAAFSMTFFIACCLYLKCSSWRVVLDNWATNMFCFFFSPFLWSHFFLLRGHHQSRFLWILVLSQPTNFVCALLLFWKEVSLRKISSCDEKFGRFWSFLIFLRLFFLLLFIIIWMWGKWGCIPNYNKVSCQSRLSDVQFENI